MAPTAVNLPPQYATQSSVSPLLSNGYPELPSYTPSPRPPLSAARRQLSLGQEQRTMKEFEYDIKNGEKKVASMTLLAEKSYSKNMPTFLQGTPVTGRVYIDVDKLETVKAITVNITGKTVPGAEPSQQVTFLDVTQTIWSAGDGLPSQVADPHDDLIVTSSAGDNSSGSSSSGHSHGNNKNGRIQYGGYSWGFSVHIPLEVSAPFGKRRQLGKFSPPETFTDRKANSSVVYDICIRFLRGKWRTDYSIPVSFGYLPLSRPPPFSILRQLAYQEGAPLLGPTADPEGWHRIDPAVVNGNLFNARDTSFKCTLFLAKPLSYTRGSLIPLVVLFEGDDQQALDLLSTPTSLDVRLGRRVRYHYEYVDIAGASRLKDTIDFYNRAVFWPSTEERSRYRRYLNGELHINYDTKPTSAVGDFRIEYTVIFSLDAPGFEPVDDRPLFIQPVDIVTAYGPGPRPRKYAPPGYDLPPEPVSFFLDR